MREEAGDRWERLLGGTAPREARHSWRRRAAPAGEERWTLSVTHLGEVFDAVVVRGYATPDGPVVVVPFYETASVLGDPCARTEGRDPAAPSQAYARMIARRGGTAVAVPWWFELHAEKDASGLDERYGPAAHEHERRFGGGMTPLGRSVADVRAVVDAVETAGWLGGGPIGVLGHSLGAKLALHVSALDARIGAAVLHEPGIGFSHSNWDAPWYLGGRRLPDGTDHDALLALIAPRPVRLIGGGASDGAHNALLVERARGAWPGDGSGLVVRQHGGGHPWPEEDAARSVDWLLDALTDPRSP